MRGRKNKQINCTIRQQNNQSHFTAVCYTKQARGGETQNGQGTNEETQLVLIIIIIRTRTWSTLSQTIQKAQRNSEHSDKS